MKKCSKCTLEKDFNFFVKNKRSSDGFHWWCKLCVKDHVKNNPELYKEINKRSYDKHKVERYDKIKILRKENPDRFKNYKLKTKYNLSLEEYNAMLLKQENKCKICNKIKKLVVDHCHKTGEVRALLCFKCNQGIGFLKDNILLMENAIKYIKEYDENFV